MKKEIIISIYDSGVNWSFSSGNRVYTKDKYRWGCYRNNIKIEKLCYFLDTHSDSSIKYFLEVVCDLYPQTSKITWSEDGYITIYNVPKGE